MKRKCFRKWESRRLVGYETTMTTEFALTKLEATFETWQMSVSHCFHWWVLGAKDGRRMRELDAARGYVRRWRVKKKPNRRCFHFECFPFFLVFSFPSRPRFDCCRVLGSKRNITYKQNCESPPVYIRRSYVILLEKMNRPKSGTIARNKTDQSTTTSKTPLNKQVPTFSCSNYLPAVF